MAETPGTLFFAHMRDGPMIRIRLPGGEITADQLLSLAEIAEMGGNGRIDLTNRANLQLRGLEAISFKALRRRLAAADLLPRAIWADRIRNILACPLSGLDSEELVDGRHLVAALDARIQDTPALKPLNPKFAFLVDSGTQSALAAYPHDVGLIAEQAPEPDEPPLLRLSLGGRLTSLAAPVSHAPELAVLAAETAIAMGKRVLHGRETHTFWARIHASFRHMGRSRETRVRRLLPQIPLPQWEAAIAAQCGPWLMRREPSLALPERPWPRMGIIRHPQTKLFALGVGVPLGRLSVTQLRLLAGLAREVGDGKLRLAPWHVIFLTGLAKDRLEETTHSLAAAGFITEPVFLRLRIHACSGRDGCRGSRRDVPGDALALWQRLQKNFAQIPAENIPALTIHVSGCAKGCAHRQKADFLALEGQANQGYHLYRDAQTQGVPPANWLASTCPPHDLAEALTAFLPHPEVPKTP